MRPEMVPSVAGTMSRSKVPRFLGIVLQGWGAITLRQWAWTTTIALLLYLAYSLGVLPAILNAVPNLLGRQYPSWHIAGVVGSVGIFVVAAYCFLLAISIAEVGAGRRLPPVRRYVAAGFAACGAAVLIEIALYVLMPSLEPLPGTLPLAQDIPRLLGRLLWSGTNFGLTGGLALAVYVRFRSAGLAREEFNAAELERVAASREVLASRLAAMQARIEPQFLLSTLAQVEALYERDPKAGDRMLDGLTAYLHAALPQLRGRRSTLNQEAQLAESYLGIMQIRMGSQLDFRIDIPPVLGGCDYPPMVLLPLVEEALRNVERSRYGGTIAITADANDGRVRIRVADDGLPRTAAVDDRLAMATLRERLRGLYGTTASLEITANAPQGVIAMIEIPRVAPRADR